MEIREQACLRRLVVGEDVWAEFWDLFGRLITAETMAFRFADNQLIDDVFQELALRLIANDYRAVKRYLAKPDRTSFAAYLRRTVRNLLIDEYRKLKRRGELELSDGNVRVFGQVVSGRNGGPQDASHALEVLKHVFSSVAGGDQNSAGFLMLHLRFVEGESVNLIARRLKMRPNTVSHRIKYYIKKIREQHLEDLKAIANA